MIFYIDSSHKVSQIQVEDYRIEHHNPKNVNWVEVHSYYPFSQIYSVTIMSEQTYSNIALDGTLNDRIIKVLKDISPFPIY